MSFSQFNIDIFRAINDLGKQYSFLNPAIVFFGRIYGIYVCFNYFSLLVY